MDTKLSSRRNCSIIDDNNTLPYLVYEVSYTNGMGVVGILDKPYYYLKCSFKAKELAQKWISHQTDSNKYAIKYVNELNIKEIIRPYHFRLIPRTKINVFSSNTTYKKNDIDNLKKSILKVGLLRNLTAVYYVEEDIYIIESGHGRIEALDRLIKEYANKNDYLEDDYYRLYLENVSEYEKGYPVTITSVLKDNIVYDDINGKGLPFSVGIRADESNYYVQCAFKTNDQAQNWIINQDDSKKYYVKKFL